MTDGPMSTPLISKFDTSLPGCLRNSGIGMDASTMRVRSWSSGQKRTNGMRPAGETPEVICGPSMYSVDKDRQYSFGQAWESISSCASSKITAKLPAEKPTMFGSRSRGCMALNGGSALIAWSLGSKSLLAEMSSQETEWKALFSPIAAQSRRRSSP